MAKNNCKKFKIMLDKTQIVWYNTNTIEHLFYLMRKDRRSLNFFGCKVHDMCDICDVAVTSGVG